MEEVVDRKNYSTRLKQAISKSSEILSSLDTAYRNDSQEDFSAAWNAMKRLHNSTRGLYYRALIHGTPEEKANRPLGTRTIPGVSFIGFREEPSGNLLDKDFRSTSTSLSSIANVYSGFYGGRYSQDAMLKKIKSATGGSDPFRLSSLRGFSKSGTMNSKRKFLFLDLETTSLSPMLGDIVEYGALLTDIHNKELDSFSCKCGPEAIDVVEHFGRVPKDEIHSISLEDAGALPTFRKSRHYRKLRKLLLDPTVTVVAHNAAFDLSWLFLNVPGFLEQWHPLLNESGYSKFSDTRLLSLIEGGYKSGSLEVATQKLALKQVGSKHSALPDAYLCRELFFSIHGRLKTKGI